MRHPFGPGALFSRAHLLVHLSVLRYLRASSSCQECYGYPSCYSRIWQMGMRRRRRPTTALASGLRLGLVQAPPRNGFRCTQKTTALPASASAVQSRPHRLRRSRHRSHQHCRALSSHRLARPLRRRHLRFCATAAGRACTSAQASRSSSGNSTRSVTAPIASNTAARHLRRHRRHLRRHSPVSAHGPSAMPAQMHLLQGTASPSTRKMMVPSALLTAAHLRRRRHLHHLLRSRKRSSMCLVLSCATFLSCSP